MYHMRASYIFYSLLLPRGSSPLSVEQYKQRRLVLVLVVLVLVLVLVPVLGYRSKRGVPASFVKRAPEANRRQTATGKIRGQTNRGQTKERAATVPATCRSSRQSRNAPPRWLLHGEQPNIYQSCLNALRLFITHARADG